MKLIKAVSKVLGWFGLLCIGGLLLGFAMVRAEYLFKVNPLVPPSVLIGVCLIILIIKTYREETV